MNIMIDQLLDHNPTFLVSRTIKDTPNETSIPVQMKIVIQMLLEKILSYPNGHKSWTVNAMTTWDWIQIFIFSIWSHLKHVNM